MFVVRKRIKVKTTGKSSRKVNKGKYSIKFRNLVNLKDIEVINGGEEQRSVAIEGKQDGRKLDISPPLLHT